MTLKYTYPRSGTLIFQRAVPADLQGRYPGKTVKQDLKTTDVVLAARLVADLNRKLEGEWEALRAAPEASPKGLRTHADAFLRQYGLTPGAPRPDEHMLSHLYAHFDSKRAKFAGGDEEVYAGAHPTQYLTPVEAAAWRRLHAAPEDTLSDLLEVYLKAHRDRDNAKFVTRRLSWTLAGRPRPRGAVTTSGVRLGAVTNRSPLCPLTATGVPAT